VTLLLTQLSFFFADSAACGINCGRVIVLMCLLALATVQSAIWLRKVRKLHEFVVIRGAAEVLYYNRRVRKD